MKMITTNNFFEAMFPRDVLDTIIEGVNKQISGDPITYGELLHWIGLWVMMSTVAGSDHRSFWLTHDLDIFDGSFFTLSNYMTQTWFENILNNLTYMNKKPPEFRDQFWEVRDMLDCWNRNFVPTWINCIDESMSKWVNKYTCPGFMFVPRKPWPFGNEYHDAGCADSDIIWALELREGKDHPTQLNNKEFDEMGKTIGTLL